MSFVINNGQILPEDGYSVKASNRGFAYGDGVFETIRIINGKVYRLDAHISRMLEGLRALKIKVPHDYTVDFFESQLNELIQKNEIEKGGKAKIMAFRNSGGAVSPLNNTPSYFISAVNYANNLFQLNEEGYKVDIYHGTRSSRNKLSMYKTMNYLEYIMAAIDNQEKGLDECFIQNEKGAIIETSSSNVFLVSNGVLYTPSIEEGCVAGTMRMHAINLAIENGIKIYECSLTPQNILVADEIFLTNAVKGIQWVGSYRTKRYFNTISKELVDKLNEDAFNLEKGPQEI